jgi:hypothetical protein
MAAFSGFQESHGPPPLGDVCGIVPAHRHGHRNSSKVDTFYIVILFAVPLAAAGAIWSE